MDLRQQHNQHSNPFHPRSAHHPRGFHPRGDAGAAGAAGAAAGPDPVLTRWLLGEQHVGQQVVHIQHEGQCHRVQHDVLPGRKEEANVERA